MAHFYGDIQGNRGMATRTGSKASGMGAHVRGWDTGVKVEIVFDPLTEKDHVYVYRTGGSHDSSSHLIAEWTEDSKAPAFYK